MGVWEIGGYPPSSSVNNIHTWHVSFRIWNSHINNDDDYLIKP